MSLCLFQLLPAQSSHGRTGPAAGALAFCGLPLGWNAMEKIRSAGVAIRSASELCIALPV
jgi:hypothetical protein